MKLFVTSPVCTSRMFCGTCRDPKAVGWRESLAETRLAIPGNNVNFDCPFGVPWNPTAEIPDHKRAQRLPLGDRIAAYLARRGVHKSDGCGCGDRQAWLNAHEARILRIVYGVAWICVAVLLLGLGALAVWIA